MKIGTIINSLLFTTILAINTGCGVDSGSAGNSRELERVSGGTAVSPADLSLKVGNKIEENSYYNHFKYRTNKDEKMSIDATLEFAITKLDRMDCQESGATYIAVFDIDMNQLEQYKTCSNTMTLNIPADTTYILKFQYPGNRGYFKAEIENL